MFYNSVMKENQNKILFVNYHYMLCSMCRSHFGIFCSVFVAWHQAFGPWINFKIRVQMIDIFSTHFFLKIT